MYFETPVWKTTTLPRISGVRTEENLVNSVFCLFPREKTKECSQNPGLVNQFSATLRG